MPLKTPFMGTGSWRALFCPCRWEQVHLPNLSISHFACRPVKPIPARLTAVASTVLCRAWCGGEPLPHQGSAQQSGQRGDRRRGTQAAAKDEGSNGRRADFPYWQKRPFLFHRPRRFSFRQDEKKRGVGKHTFKRCAHKGAEQRF